MNSRTKIRELRPYALSHTQRVSGPIPARLSSPTPIDCRLDLLDLVMEADLLLGIFSSAMSLLISGAYAAEAEHTMYRVISLGDPGGGTPSQSTSNNQDGWVVGFSTLPGNAVMHAELWGTGPRNPSGRSAVRTAPSRDQAAIAMAWSRGSRRLRIFNRTTRHGATRSPSSLALRYQRLWRPRRNRCPR